MSLLKLSIRHNSAANDLDLMAQSSHGCEAVKHTARGTVLKSWKALYTRSSFTTPLKEGRAIHPRSAPKLGSTSPLRISSGDCQISQAQEKSPQAVDTIKHFRRTDANPLLTVSHARLSTGHGEKNAVRTLRVPDDSAAVLGSPAFRQTLSEGGKRRSSSVRP